MDNSQSEITLSCADHHQILINRLWNFFLGNQEVDFDIRWGDQALKAHHLILAVFLPPEKLGRSAPAENLSDPGKVCGVNDCSQLKTMVEFLYKGQVTLPKKQLAQLMEVAREMEFRQLVDAIETATSENAIEVELPRNTTNTSDSIELETVKVKCEVDSEESATEDVIEMDFPPNAANAIELQTVRVKCEVESEESDTEDVIEMDFPCNTANTSDAIELPTVRVKYEVDSEESAAEDVIEVDFSENTANPSGSTSLRITNVKCEFNAEEWAVDCDPPVDADEGSDVDAVKSNPEATANADKDVGPIQSSGQLDSEMEMEMGVIGSCRVEPPRTRPKIFPAKHAVVITPGEPSYPCQQCGKVFRLRHHLKSHMMIHTGERPHKCRLCLWTFTQRAHLNRHMANIHTTPIPGPTPPIKLKRKLDDLPSK